MAGKESAALQIVDRLMREMIEQQEHKVLDLGQRIHPGLTAEDIRNPQDYPDLIDCAQWNFEDGILAGLKSAHIAIRARLLEDD
ncbi:MAG: hypothetical protein ABSD31_10055 [Candidatus Binataceae bacterium]|jgi:hypothetical protein